MSEPLFNIIEVDATGRKRLETFDGDETEASLALWARNADAVTELDGIETYIIEGRFFQTICIQE